MTSPEVLERRAATLRSAARRARTKARGLATHLDDLLERARDEELWKGPYPTRATGDLTRHQKRLDHLADELNADADLWVRRAAELEDQADEEREKQKREEEKEDGDG